MLILDLLGLFFHAVVIFVTSQTLLFRLALAILWQTRYLIQLKHNRELVDGIMIDYLFCCMLAKHKL